MFNVRVSHKINIAFHEIYKKAKVERYGMSYMSMTLEILRAVSIFYSTLFVPLVVMESPNVAQRCRKFVRK